jgi:hypothetical protein
MVKAPEMVPAAAGANRNLMVQPLPGDSVPGQFEEWAKAPVAAMEEMVSGPVPELNRVAICKPLTVPIC